MLVNARVGPLKKLSEETVIVYVHNRHLKTPLSIYFNFFPNYFQPKFEFPNLECGSYAGSFFFSIGRPKLEMRTQLQSYQ